ncbi:hypothetical protein [Candidatus Chromulinivorax destructor]|uniref:Uncharacterized protein n=1 Tax=Candidatus Chromulinivorax destructor TaxID=2066483 RepID=A0A345ZAW9_9BACT|nr:hypothetical protein [Candidatus Chromulinivorax destructor]AXK60436.1 hypothetical protein C0J27_01585 [Candidatus Chromulinivorax destructor]
MKYDMLKFILNSSEYFFINLHNTNDVIDCCYRTSIFLNLNNNQTEIANEDIQEYSERFDLLLTLALSQELKLHISIKKDLGFYWNQDMNEKNPAIFYEQGDGHLDWIGTKYLLWSTSGEAFQQFGTWLYNDKFGNIIFEVTPIYPKTFINKEDPVEVKAYQEWMKKSYKPFYTRIIPKEVAEQWLKQCKLLLQTIHDNTKRLDEQEEL